MVDPRLRDEDPVVRLTALAELFSSREADPDKLEDAAAFLAHSDENGRRLAVEVLVMYGADAAPYLTSALDKSQPLPIRTAAAAGLGRLGPDGMFGASGLVRCLESEDEQLREKSSWALSTIGTGVLPLLRSALRSPVPLVVLGAVNALERIGEEAAEALDDLQQITESADSAELRVPCLAAVGSISAAPDQVVPEILSSAEGASEEIRKMCVERVGNLCGLASGFGDGIARFALDEAPSVRSAAAAALGKIHADPTNSVPVLITLLDDPAEEVRRQAVIALACLGPEASDAVPVLERINREGEERLAGMAGAALQRIDVVGRAET